MKRTARTIGLATVTALAAACGGGGGGGGGGGNDTDSSTTFNLSGTAIDGYLQEATVCIDRNFNSRCDDSEPGSVTDDAGEFTISEAAEEYRNSPTLVRAIAGQTTDAGNDINTAFDLKAPQSAKVVTPLTTLVQVEAEDRLASGQSGTLEDAIADAKAEIEGLLGNARGNLDILDDDYIALQSSSDADESTTGEKVSAIARAVNRILTETRTQARNSLDDDDETNLNSNGTLDTAILNTAAQKVQQKVSAISGDVDQAIDDGDTVDTAATAAADNNPVTDIPDFNELSQEVEDIETVESEVSGDDTDATGATGGTGG